VREGLVPPANPHATPPAGQEPVIARGRELFASPAVGCAGCHDPDRALTGGGTFDLGLTSTAELDSQRRFDRRRPAPVLDTPSLRQLALTAPYLHDGSAATLDALLTRTDGKMGDTKQLPPEDRRGLVAYLETL
jgi:cytochrome c peroxidase